ncbi:Uncharacterised protein [Klebsiella pneumoniae]|nr:Uncharacterised protein [Klebsiella pneumoniae]
MSELFKWTMAVVFVLTYYSLFFLLTVIQCPKFFLITGKMTAGCLRLILIKVFSLQREIDFSVVMLLKM